MRTYKITYTRCGRTITTTRKGEKAEDAIFSLCDQYAWRAKLNMISADDNGIKWAKCSADTDGGINWNITIHADLAN